MWLAEETRYRKPMRDDYTLGPFGQLRTLRQRLLSQFGGILPSLTLTITWQAVRPVANDYTTFVHVLTADNTKAAQRDSRPCDSECPTDTWQLGEIIVDRYELALNPDAPSGPYHLAVGLYLLETGDRAAVVGQDDQMVILDVP